MYIYIFGSTSVMMNILFSSLEVFEIIPTYSKEVIQINFILLTSILYISGGYGMNSRKTTYLIINK